MRDPDCMVIVQTNLELHVVELVMRDANVCLRFSPEVAQSVARLMIEKAQRLLQVGHA